MRSLIVAIDDYPGTQADLNSCINDASYFENLLNQGYGVPPKNIKKLTNSNATITNVVEALSWLFSDADHDEPLVFFYSGHGTPLPVNDQGDVEEALYLYDGPLIDDRIVQESSKSNSRKITMFLDCCHSLGMSKQIPPSIVGEMSPAIGYPALTKCWMPPVGKGKAKSGSTKTEAIRSYKPFGRRRVTAVETNTKLFNSHGTLTWATFDDEATDPEFNGIVLAACGEEETASAATPFTDGLSAFTFALSKIIQELGLDIINDNFISLARARVRNNGFRQTPKMYVSTANTSARHSTLFDQRRTTIGHPVSTAGEPLQTKHKSFFLSESDLLVADRLDPLLARQVGLIDRIDPSNSQHRTLIGHVKGVSAVAPFSGVSEQFATSNPSTASIAKESEMNAELTEVVKRGTADILGQSWCGQSVHKTGDDKFFPGFVEVILPVIVNEVVDAIKHKGISFGVNTPIGGLGLSIKSMVDTALAEKGLNSTSQDKFFPGFVEVILPVIVNEVVDAIKHKGISFGVNTPIGGLGFSIKSVVDTALAEKGLNSTSQDKFFPGFVEVILPVIVNEVIDAIKHKGISFGVNTPIGGLGLSVKGMVDEALAK